MTGHEQEVNSASQGDFTPVVSKAAKRRARRAAAKARKVASEKHTTNVRKAASPHSALPSSSKPKVNKPSIHKMELRSHRPTLGEWPVRVRPTSPTKQVQPYAPSSSVLKIKEMTPTSVPSKTLGGCPLKPAKHVGGIYTHNSENGDTSNNVSLLGQLHCPQPHHTNEIAAVGEANPSRPLDKGKKVVTEHSSSSSESDSLPRTQLLVETP